MAARCIHIDSIRLAFLIHLSRLKYSETSSVFDNSDQGQGYSEPQLIDSTES